MSKQWSASDIKKRGWTEDLMRSLLPRPRYRRTNFGSIRLWPIDVVRKAEKTPAFQEYIAAQKSTIATFENISSKETVPQQLLAAIAFLEDAWQAMQMPDTPEAKLARHYHKAILRLIPGTGWAVRLSAEQAIGRMTNFLTQFNNKKYQSSPQVIKNFVTGMPWLAANTSDLFAARLQGQYATTLVQLARAELELFKTAQPEAMIEQLIDMEDFPFQELIARGLGYIYSLYYVPLAIRSSLDTLAALNPKDEYPHARAMRRHFVLHIGGTNTGKTYAGFQRLIRAETGVYLAPLRLLALEGQERLLDNGIACSLTTGEEEDCRDGDTHVAATAEKLDLNRLFEVAVIDECQMVADRERGYAWTRAILGVQAPEVHLCTAPEARQILLRMIQSCGDTFEVIEHERKTPLVCMPRIIDYREIQPGDALISFSKVCVLSISEDLRRRGK